MTAKKKRPVQPSPSPDQTTDAPSPAATVSNHEPRDTRTEGNVKTNAGR